jgi:membrane protein implicated in regulation of membrane protease activity
VSGGRGQAFIEGAWWNVRSQGTELVDGEEVRIVAVDGLDLLGEPAAAQTDNRETGER